jgi:RNA polymerase sigma-70 factor
MEPWRPDDAAVHRLYRRANADRWRLPLAPFADALERSARKHFAAQAPDGRTLGRYFESLHLDDLALACACALGIDEAWDFFVRQHRPALYRAADAIDPSGAARELADSLYGELYGLSERDGERRSQFLYFHGRSSLTTWLRAVLSQRHVDRLRSGRRLDALPDDESPDALPAVVESTSPEWPRYLSIIRRALAAAVDELTPRDRLRLGCYYAQQLTLAEIGRMLGEHEATVSRKLARTRSTLRERVETELREREAMGEAEIAECFAAVVQDSGPLDLAKLIAPEPGKNAAPDRSIG